MWDPHDVGRIAQTCKPKLLCAPAYAPSSLVCASIRQYTPVYASSIYVYIYMCDVHCTTMCTHVTALPCMQIPGRSLVYYFFCVTTVNHFFCVLLCITSSVYYCVVPLLVWTTVYYFYCVPGRSMSLRTKRFLGHTAGSLWRLCSQRTTLTHKEYIPCFLDREPYYPLGR